MSEPLETVTKFGKIEINFLKLFKTQLRYGLEKNQNGELLVFLVSKVFKIVKF